MLTSHLKILCCFHCQNSMQSRKQTLVNTSLKDEVTNLPSVPNVMTSVYTHDGNIVLCNTSIELFQACEHARGKP